MSARTLVALGATVAAASLALVAPAAQAAPSTLTVANASSITPPDGNPAGISSTLAVSGQSGLITDLDVVLTGVSSTYPSDLDIALIAPNGTTVMLMSDECNSTDITALTFTFDDEAPGGLPDDTCTGGRFWPHNEGLTDGPGFPAPTRTALHAFDGVSPNGTWRLAVADDTATDTATIAGGFSLTFQLSDTVAPTVSLTGKVKPSPKATQKVSFTADDAGSTFECSVDGAGYLPCHSPFKVKKLTFGKHKVQIKATDPSGNEGAPLTVTLKRVAAR